jgi:hypothetical protein
MNRFLVGTCCVFFMMAEATAQLLPLPTEWLFKPGDSAVYKNPDCDDSKWVKIHIPGLWEDQGYPDLDGYAWLRLHFKLDKSQVKDGLYMLLGKVDDLDESYLNGQWIGTTGNFGPDAVTESNTQRIYKIPDGLLKEDNILAMRIYDIKYVGGIAYGLIGISDKKTYTKMLNLGPAPKKCFYQLATSNGLIAAVYNEKLNLVEVAYPHIFQSYDGNKKVMPFLKNLKLLTDEQPVSVNTMGNTHIIEARYKDFTVRYFAPFTTGEKILYAAIDGRKKAVDTLRFSCEKVAGTLLTETIGVPGKKKLYRKFFLFTFNDSLHRNNEVLSKALSSLGNKDMIREEYEYMLSVFNKSYIPSGLTEDERNLYEQSICVLKMGQVSQKEIFERSRGQILASVPPGGWNICWLRDGCYALMAFTRLKLFDEARNLLNFYLNADVGYYKNYIYKDGIDYGIKSDYRLSVCRYFGIGKEESDFNEFGPNIELDGFGLFLLAFVDYINSSGDVQFLQDHMSILTGLIADPMISFIDANNVLRRDSGPWERHLPGQQYAFTSIVNAAALRNFADLLKQQGLPGYEKYMGASDVILDGIKTHLVYNNKLIKGFVAAASPNDLDFFDGGTIEVFTFGLFTDPAFFKSNFTAYEKVLRISDRRGFSRLNNPDWYCIGEWPFLDLRISCALARFGDKTKAKYLIDWITSCSKPNFNYIAELYGNKDENYEGAVPMVGFGAGAYILAICDYYSTR